MFIDYFKLIDSNGLFIFQCFSRDINDIPYVLFFITGKNFEDLINKIDFEISNRLINLNKLKFSNVSKEFLSSYKLLLNNYIIAKKDLEFRIINNLIDRR